MKKLNKQSMVSISGGKISSSACFFAGAAAVMYGVTPFGGISTMLLAPTLKECWNS